MRAIRFVALVGLVGCAGMDRCWADCNAENFGSDWVVVQTDLSGRAFRCWELHGASIANEEHSDGIYWKDPSTQNLVHISNLYNRVQVVGGAWNDAFIQLGITREQCRAIRYGTAGDGGTGP